MSEEKEKYHPIWRILINLSFLFILLFANASNFDATEIRTLVLFMLGHGAVEKFIK